MASTFSFIEFIVEQLDKFGNSSYKKMFGEYGIFLEYKCIFLVCNDTIYCKQLPELSDFFKENETGYPYNGAKLHYVVDIEDNSLLESIIPILLEKTSVRVKKTKVKK